MLSSRHEPILEFQITVTAQIAWIPSAVFVITKKLRLSGRCSMVLSILELSSNEYCNMVYKSVHAYCSEFICQSLGVCFFFLSFFLHLQSTSMNSHILLYSFTLSELPVLINFLFFWGSYGIRINDESRTVS